MKARNIKKIKQLSETSYVCQIELYDEWSNTWNKAEYGVVEGGSAPVNEWILSEIKTGKYKIKKEF